MSLSRFVSDALWDSSVTQSLPVRVAGTLADAACVRAFILASMHGYRELYASVMHSLLELPFLAWFYIACLSLQSFAFLNCFNLIVIFKAMGRYCEPASCWSNDNKLKTSKNTPGWETWPGWNSQQTLQHVRLGGGRSCLGSRRQDKFEITAHSPLCSLHFDKEQLQNDGHAVGFPKYFYWNNYWLVLNPRKSGAVEKRAQAEAAVASQPAASPDPEPQLGCR